jgi:SAM-dependent methyltransferase
VDTGGLIYADPAAEGHAGGRHNAGYYATAPSLFHGAMALWRGTLPETGYALEDCTLVDIGCGKGRVLMLATEYAFREIVGVELDPGLARVARKNLSRFGRRRWLGLRGPKFRTWAIRSVRIIEGDALTEPLPDGPVALFYFNSFEREMMEMWLARLGEIAAHRHWPLDLIYIHPEFGALVRQMPGTQALAEADIPFSEEDTDADLFEVAEDRCVIFRLTGEGGEAGFK